MSEKTLNTASRRRLQAPPSIHLCNLLSAGLIETGIARRATPVTGPKTMGVLRQGNTAPEEGSCLLTFPEMHCSGTLQHPQAESDHLSCGADKNIVRQAGNHEYVQVSTQLYCTWQAPSWQVPCVHTSQHFPSSADWCARSNPMTLGNHTMPCSVTQTTQNALGSTVRDRYGGSESGSW